MNKKKYRGYPGDNPNEPNETASVDPRLAELEAELAAEREKIKNQNSYITRLEAERKAAEEKANRPAQVTKPTNTPPPSTGDKPLSAAERYAIGKATQEIIQNQEAALKEKYGEEVYSEFKDEFISIAKTNIKDPFNVPEDLFVRVEAMALGRAMTSEDKRVKIAGAFIKQPDPVPAVAPQAAPVVVNDPANQKINTLTPDDKQTLGTPTPQNPNKTKRMTREEFFSSLNKNKNVIR